MLGKRLGGRFVAGGVAVVLGLAGCAAGVALHRHSGRPGVASSGSAHPPQATATDPAATSRDRALQELLNRHAAAVLAHDEAGFLADIDPSATKFRARQKAVFRGLVRVPFQHFGYRLLPGRSYHLPASTKRWGPTTYVAAVVATHRLRGFDTGDAAEAMAFTAVQRAGRWKLVADDEADASLPQRSHAAPWDLGEVAVAQGKHSVVIGDVRDRSQLAAVARRVDAAALAVSRLWPKGRNTWPGSVVVYSARNPQVMDTYLDGEQDADTRPAALAVAVRDRFAWFESMTQAPKDVGMRVVVDGAASKAKDDVLLRHELTHVATNRTEGAGTPTWMVEGIAEYTAWRPRDVRDALVRRGVDDASYRAIKGRRYAMTLPFSSRFYDDADTVDSNYTSGLLACAYVEQRWGERTLLRLHAELSRKVEPLDEVDTQERVFRSVLGISRSSFEKALSAEVQRRWYG